nr:MAG TPA: hypothetical protein [Caudoviricetes sp.]
MPQSLYRGYCRTKHFQLLLCMLICLEQLSLA